MYIMQKSAVKSVICRHFAKGIFIRKKENEM